MNQQELLALTAGGETLAEFAQDNGLNAIQLEGLAWYAVTPNMTSQLFVDAQRLVFVHGDGDANQVLEAVDTYGLTHDGDTRAGGVRMHIHRSPVGEMYSVHVNGPRVVPV